MIRRWSYLGFLHLPNPPRPILRKRSTFYKVRFKRFKTFPFSFFPRRAYFNVFFWRYFLSIYKNISFWFSYFINFINLYKYEKSYEHQSLIIPTHFYSNKFNNFFIFNQYCSRINLFLTNLIFFSITNLFGN